ncbi:hypothetical protein OH76DRAFT_1467772 [Lentinus brumalis]|uniref:Uncharacterized protein n=1 Tax=Lentinus brumalis TaxID=2498619 RepID=A0A371DXM1_9APHY|nr:hypothetical protein OH76DRAFT_1467772 [Polyporus brumalis]
MLSYSYKLGGHVARTCCGRRFYSSKVRAFPFVLSKEQAIQQLSVQTAIYTGYKLFGTYLRQFFPNLNVEALRPTRLQPAYVPAWYIDAQVQATLWLKSSPEDAQFRKNDAEVQFAHTYMPGFVYPPLSEQCFQTTQLLRTEPAPWSEDMRQHHGDEVLCLPFTMSPFRLTEACRGLSMADAMLDLLRFEPSSLRETMMAAYPVLFPVYLAQFTVNTPVKGRKQELVITSFIEATSNQPRVYVELVPVVEDLYKLLGLADGTDGGRPGLVVVGQDVENPPRFGNVRSILASQATLQHRQYIEHWINLALSHGDPLRQYYDRYFAKGKGTVDWEDVRIRPFTFEERTANVRWLESAENLYVLEKMLEGYEAKRENHTASPDEDATGDPNQDSEATQTPIQSIQDQIQTLKRTREESKPEWLAQYEIQQRLLAKAPSTEVRQ